MRTTVNLDDTLLREYKELAARTGRTLGDVIQDALREASARRKRPREAAAVDLITVGGRGLLPGISIDCTAALIEQIEGPLARP